MDALDVDEDPVSTNTEPNLEDEQNITKKMGRNAKKKERRRRRAQIRNRQEGFRKLRLEVERLGMEDIFKGGKVSYHSLPNDVLDAYFDKLLKAANNVHDMQELIAAVKELNV